MVFWRRQTSDRISVEGASGAFGATRHKLSTTVLRIDKTVLLFAIVATLEVIGWFI